LARCFVEEGLLTGSKTCKVAVTAETVEYSDLPFFLRKKKPFFPPFSEKLKKQPNDFFARFFLRFNF